MSRRQRRAECVFLLIVVSAGFMLRVWGIPRVHYWDEAVYLQNAEVICCHKSNYSELNSRPPLLSLFFTGIFLLRHSIYAADIATALLNALAPLFLYLAGRMIVGRIAAGIAALLLALSPFLIGVFPVWFDSDNTGNSLLSDSPALTLTVMGFWLMLLAIRRPSHWRFALAGVVFGLTVLMRFAAVSVAGILSLLVFASPRWWRAALAAAFGFLGVMLPYLCWSRVTYGRFFETLIHGWTAYQGERQPVLFYARNFGVVFGWITLAGLLLWVTRWSLRKAQPALAEMANGLRPAVARRMQYFLWVWAGLGFLFFLALPHQEPRYLMPVMPPLFLLAGSGLCWPITQPRKVIGIAGMVAVSGALLLTFAPDTERLGSPFVDQSISEEMQVSEFLDRNFPKSTILYSNFNYPVFGYYSHLQVRELPRRGSRLYAALNNLSEDGILVTYRDVPEVSDPSPEWIRSNPHLHRIREFDSIVLYQYRRQDGTAPSATRGHSGAPA